MRKRIKIFGLVVFHLFIFSETPAETNIQSNQRALPFEILFIGDSLTHGKYPPVLQYNKDKVTDLNAGLSAASPRYERKKSEPGPWGGIPGIVKQFSIEAGLNYQISIEAISARSLAFHAKVAESEPANQLKPPPIYQAKWNVVVLQDLSTGPLPSKRLGNKKQFIDAVQTLEKGFHKANPKTKLYLYQTWPTAREIYSKSGSYHDIHKKIDALKTMNEDLYQSYAEAASTCCSIIPVGNAWISAIKDHLALKNPEMQKNNQINLWAKDNLHPSIYGAYLSALVIFATISGTDPRQLGYEEAAKSLGITKDIALKLQEQAYKAWAHEQNT